MNVDLVKENIEKTYQKILDFNKRIDGFEERDSNTFEENLRKAEDIPELEAITWQYRSVWQDQNPGVIQNNENRCLFFSSLKESDPRIQELWQKTLERIEKIKDSCLNSDYHTSFPGFSDITKRWKNFPQIDSNEFSLMHWSRVNNPEVQKLTTSANFPVNSDCSALEKLPMDILMSCFRQLSFKSILQLKLVNKKIKHVAMMVLTVWDIRGCDLPINDKELQSNLEKHFYSVRTINKVSHYVTRNHRLILGCFDPNNIQIWDTRSWQLLKVLEQEKEICSLSIDDSYLVSCSDVKIMGYKLDSFKLHANTEHKEGKELVSKIYNCRLYIVSIQKNIIAIFDLNRFNVLSRIKIITDHNDSFVKVFDIYKDQMFFGLYNNDYRKYERPLQIIDLNGQNVKFPVSENDWRNAYVLHFNKEKVYLGLKEKMITFAVDFPEEHEEAEAEQHAFCSYDRAFFFSDEHNAYFYNKLNLINLKNCEGYNFQIQGGYLISQDQMANTCSIPVTDNRTETFTCVKIVNLWATEEETLMYIAQLAYGFFNKANDHFKLLPKETRNAVQRELINCQTLARDAHIDFERSYTLISMIFRVAIVRYLQKITTKKAD